MELVKGWEHPQASTPEISTVLTQMVVAFFDEYILLIYCMPLFDFQNPKIIFSTILSIFVAQLHFKKGFDGILISPSKRSQHIKFLIAAVTLMLIYMYIKCARHNSKDTSPRFLPLGIFNETLMNVFKGLHTINKI